MKNISLSILLTISICFMISGSLLFAEKHSIEDVAKLIKEVESKLDTIKEEGAEQYAGKEIAKIEVYIKNAKIQLDSGKVDVAYYEAGKVNAYFKLIKAKKELSIAEAELKTAEEKTGK